MALVLVQLRLAIQRRALGHSGTGQRALFLAGWVLALVLGLAAGTAVERLASARDGLGDLALVLILTVVFLGWLLSPLLMPGVGDETVDPARLEQFPISPRDQVVGLLLGSMLAPTALFTFLVAAGATFASGETVPARMLVLLAAVVFTVLCVAASRAVMSLLAGVMRSRRARDMAIIGGGVISLAVYLLSRNMTSAMDALVELQSEPVEATLSWLPPGSAGQAMIAVRDGSWGMALAHLALAVIAIGALLAVWAAGIRRRLRGPAGRRGAARERTSAADLVLVPLPLAALPATPSTAAAAQQLRYFFFRQPRAVQTLVFLPIIGIIMSHSLIAEAGLPLGVAVYAVMVVMGVAFTMLDYDDRGITYLITAGAPLRSVLAGKSLAALVVTVPLVAAVVVGEALVNDAWGEAAEAFLAGVNVLVVGVGVGSVISVWAPQNRGQVSGGRRRPGVLKVLMGQFGGLGIVFALAAGLLILWEVLSDLGGTLATLVTLPVSVGLGWALVRWSGGWLARDPWRVQRILVG